MKAGPDIAIVASLLGDQARANMLSALMAGKALTATELAAEAGVTAPTASAHLAKLAGGGLVAAVKQGRHRYFRLADPDVAEVIEKLMGLAARAGHLRTRTGPRDPAMRHARVCYDHLAGDLGVALYDSLVRRRLLADSSEEPRLTASGRAFLGTFGIDLAALESERRPLCRSCLDWSERRSHLAGSLGAALLARFVVLGWARREARSRIVTFSPRGERAFAKLIGGAPQARV